jgi:hypothetical protein
MVNSKNKVGGSGYWLKRRNHAMAGARYQMGRSVAGTEHYPGEAASNARICVVQARRYNRERVAALRIERHVVTVVQI